MSDSSILPDVVAKALDLLSDYIMQYEGQHDDESDARAAFKVIDRYTRQRDAAIRARALEEAVMTAKDFSSGVPPGYGRGYVLDLADEIRALIPTPPAPAPDEAKSRVIGSVIGGHNAQAGVHQVTTHETGGVTDPIPGENDEAAKQDTRSNSDYAIEFGRYLATAAEHFMFEQNRAAEAEEDPNQDAWNFLADAIYQFRKRADRTNVNAVANPDEGDL